MTVAVLPPCPLRSRRTTTLPQRESSAASEAAGGAAGAGCGGAGGASLAIPRRARRAPNVPGEPDRVDGGGGRREEDPDMVPLRVAGSRGAGDPQALPASYSFPPYLK